MKDDHSADGDKANVDNQNVMNRPVCHYLWELHNDNDGDKANSYDDFDESVIIDNFDDFYESVIVGCFELTSAIISRNSSSPASQSC